MIDNDLHDSMMLSGWKWAAEAHGFKPVDDRASRHQALEASGL